MTISVPADLVFIDQGDGVTTEFSYPVKFLEASELVVFSREAGVDTTLVLNTHYTVSGAGVDGGGTITMLYVPSAAEEIGRYRATGAKQIVNLQDGVRNPAEAVEDQLDRFAMVGQDNKERIARSVKVAPGSGPLKDIPTPEAGMPLLGNAGQDGFLWGDETYEGLRARVNATESHNTTQDGRLDSIESLNTTQNNRLDAVEPLADRAWKAPTGSGGSITAGADGQGVRFDASGNLVPSSAIPGSGDMLSSAFDPNGIGSRVIFAENNGGDFLDPAAVRTNLGLGTAATTDASAYATAAQGATADAALPKAGGTVTGDLAVDGALTATPVGFTTSSISTKSFPAVVMSFRTSGYGAAGDGGAAEWKRVAGDPGHGLARQSADGAWWEIAENSVHVRMAGAKGDGVTDDAAAFQVAIDWLKSKVAASPGGNNPIGIAPAAVRWSGGVYRLNGSLNLQSIVGQGWELDGTGGILHLACAGKTGLDALGSRWGIFRNLHIVGDATNTPAIGVQIGRLTRTGPADCHTFIDPMIQGHFSRDAVYNLGSETDTWRSPRIYNEAAGGYCMSIDGCNLWGAITDFTAPTMATGEAFSCIQHLIDCCDFRQRTSGRPFRATRTDQLGFEKGYMVSIDNSAMLFVDNGDGFRDIDLDVHCEQHTVAPGLQHCVEFDRTSSGETTFQGFRFNEEWLASAVSPFKVGSNITTLRLNSADIAFHTIGVTQSAGSMFGDTGVVVTGDIRLPTVGDLQTGNITLNGRLSGRAVSNLALPRGSFVINDQGQRAHHKGGHLFWGNEASPTVAGDQITEQNVFLHEGVIYVRGDASNIPSIIFTTGPNNTTTLARIAPAHGSGNLNITVGSQAFSLRADGTLQLPVLTADPASATEGGLWYRGDTDKYRGRAGAVNVDLN